MRLFWWGVEMYSRWDAWKARAHRWLFCLGRSGGIHAEETLWRVVEQRLREGSDVSMGPWTGGTRPMNKFGVGDVIRRKDATIDGTIWLVTGIRGDKYDTMDFRKEKHTGCLLITMVDKLYERIKHLNTKIPGNLSDFDSFEELESAWEGSKWEDGDIIGTRATPGNELVEIVIREVTRHGYIVYHRGRPEDISTELFSKLHKGHWSKTGTVKRLGRSLDL